jgi:hypothetical protein
MVDEVLHHNTENDLTLGDVVDEPWLQDTTVSRQSAEQLPLPESDDRLGRR